MKWSVPKDALECAVKIVNLVPTRNGVHCSEFIKLSKYEKTAATMSMSSDMSAEAILASGEKYPFKEDLFLDRRMFIPFIDAGRESKTDIYEFLLKDDGSLMVKHGHRKATYERAKPVKGYEEAPDLKKKNAVALKNKEWTKLLDLASMCATDDPVAAQFNCVYVAPMEKTLELFASNGQVIFRGRTPAVKGLQNIAFPLLLADCLDLDETVTLEWTDRVAVVHFPRAKVWQPVKVAARKRFPLKDVRALTTSAREFPVAVNISASALSRAAERIQAYVAALSRESLVFSITLKEGSRKVVIESGATASKFNETISAMEPASISTTIEWPLDHVMAVLLWIKDEGNARIHLSKKGQTFLATKSVSLMVAKANKEE